MHDSLSRKLLRRGVLKARDARRVLSPLRIPSRRAGPKKQPSLHGRVIEPSLKEIQWSSHGSVQPRIFPACSDFS